MEQKPSESIQPSSCREESPSEFLRSVRAQTSYGTLRAVITIVSVLLIAITSIAMVPAILIALQTREYAAVGIIIALVVAIINIVLLIAAKQFVTMFVDMADTLIEQNRKKAK